MKIGEKKTSFTIGKLNKIKIKFGEKKPMFTIKPKRKIRDVPAFHQGTSIPIKTKEDLKDIVEEPCLQACQELFEKNIETMDSGCNGENCADCAYIIMNYDTMDTQNQLVAQKMIHQGKAKFFPKSDVCVRNYFNQVCIKIQTSPDDNVSDVSKKLCQIIQDFVPQRKIVKKMDPKQVIEMHMRAQRENYQRT